MTLAANADILIVDDTPTNLNVLSAIFGKRGYRVRPAINGALALKAAQKAATGWLRGLPPAQGRCANARNPGDLYQRAG
jgi:CheY-like chemotaxis protein